MSEWPPQAHLKIMAADAQELLNALDDATLAANRGDDTVYYKAVLRRWVRKLEASLERL